NRLSRFGGADFFLCITRESGLMWITTEEAIEIYAHYWRARFGPKASSMARKRATELGRLGDAEGERVGSALTANIDKHRRSLDVSRAWMSCRPYASRGAPHPGLSHQCNATVLWWPVRSSRCKRGRRL